jgi:hypothetical protein
MAMGASCEDIFYVPFLTKNPKLTETLWLKIDMVFDGRKKSRSTPLSSKAVENTDSSDQKTLGVTHSSDFNTRLTWRPN